MNLTPALLRAATGCLPAYADLYAEPLAEACEGLAITTPARLAAFLAQIGHESGSLRYVAEIWGPTDAQRRYEPPSDLARRLGNTQPGDGFRYRGRGLLQTTGRGNYRLLRDRLRDRGIDAPDFEAAPEQLEQPRWACLSAALYWHDHGCNEMADRGEFGRISRAINLGDPDSPHEPNGAVDRRARLQRAQQALAEAETPAEPADAPSATISPAAEPVSPTADVSSSVREPIRSIPAGEGSPQEPYTMPAPIIAALLPAAIDAVGAAVPALIRTFGGGSAMSERNAKAAELVVDVAKQAAGAVNEQELITKVQADPSTAASVKQAVQERWHDVLELAEAGGGGIAAARKADAAAMAADAPWWAPFRSPSFWALLLLIPLVYLIVLSLVGVLGDVKWSQDARGGIAGMITGTIVGGAVGYYWGQVTSRNRGPAQGAA